MRNKKIQGQGLFDVTNERRSHVSKAKENGKRSPSKKISPRGKRKLSFPKKIPGLLNGKRFFLDLHGFGKENFAKDIIEQLGGILEDFNSKEVYCIITNRFTVDEINTHRAETRRGTPSPMQGPVPSPLMPGPSPLQQISSNKGAVNSPLSTDSPQTPQSLDPKAPHITRGKSLQIKAVTSTQKQGSSNLLQLAKKWGTKVMHINQFLSWSKEKKVAELLLQLKSAHRGKSGPSSSHSNGSATRVKNLKSPFIRIEDQSRNYRPVYAELAEWPSIHFESVAGSCPFEKPKERNTPTEPNEQISDKETNKDDSPQTMSEMASEKQPDRPVEKKDVKCGYCECCSVRFDDMSKHLKSDQHRTFAKNDVNYAALDLVIKKGSTFDDFLAEVHKKYQKGTMENEESDRPSPCVDVKDEVFQTASEKISLQRNIYCEEGEEKHQAEFQEEEKIQTEQTEEEMFSSNASKNTKNNFVNDSEVGNAEISERKKKQDLDIQTHDEAPICVKSEFEDNAEKQSCALKPQDDEVQPNELIDLVTHGAVVDEATPSENTSTKPDDRNVNDKGLPLETNFALEGAIALGALKINRNADRDFDEKDVPPVGVEGAIALQDPKVDEQADSDVDEKSVAPEGIVGAEEEKAREELNADGEATLSKEEDQTEVCVKPVEALEINGEKCSEKMAVFKDDNKPAPVRDDALAEYDTKHEESVEKVVEKSLQNVEMSKAAVFKDDNQRACAREEVMSGVSARHEESVEMGMEKCLENVDMSRTAAFKNDNQQACGREEVTSGVGARHKETVDMGMEQCLENVDMSRTMAFKDENNPDSVGAELKMGVGVKHKESAEVGMKECLENVDMSGTMAFKDENHPASVGAEVKMGVGVRHIESAEVVEEECLEKCQNTTTIDDKDDQVQENDDSKPDACQTVLEQATADDTSTGSKDNDVVAIVEEIVTQPRPVPARADDKSLGNTDNDVLGNVEEPISIVSNNTRILRKRNQSTHLNSHQETEDEAVLGNAEEAISIVSNNTRILRKRNQSTHLNSHQETEDEAVLGNVEEAISIVSNNTRILRKRNQSTHLNSHQENEDEAVLGNVEEAISIESNDTRILRKRNQSTHLNSHQETEDEAVLGNVEEAISIVSNDTRILRKRNQSTHLNIHQENDDKAVLGNVEEAISIVSNDTRILRKRNQSTHLNIHQENDDKAVLGNVEEPINDVSEEKTTLPKRKPSARLNDNQEEFSEADYLEDNQIILKTDASVARGEDVAANDPFAHTPVSLENIESIQNSPRKTEEAASLKDETSNPDPRDQDEHHSNASLDGHTDIKSLLERCTRVAKPEADLQCVANSRASVEKGESQERANSERMQFSAFVSEEENGEKVSVNDKQGLIKPGKSEKKSRKSEERRSSSRNVQRAKELPEEPRKLRATTSRKSSPPKMRSLRSSGSKGLMHPERRRSKKSKKKRANDQAIDEPDNVNDNDRSGSTDSCSSPDLKKAVPNRENHDRERSFSGSSTEEQTGSISSNDATVDEDSFRELDSSILIVEEPQVLSPAKKLEQGGNAEFSRGRRNALGEVSPGSDCSVRIMFVEEAKKHTEFAVSNTEILSDKETQQSYNIPRPKFGAPAERYGSNAATETAVNRNSFLIKSPIGSDGSPLEELPFEQGNCTQLVDTSLPGKADIKEASKEEIDTVEVDSSDDSRDATHKSNKHGTSDLKIHQQGHVDSAFTTLIAGESSKKTAKESELRCNTTNETDTIALRKHETSNDQPFHTELKRNITADTSISESQCVIPARDATLSLIQSPIERGKWQPVIDGESPDQGCLFSSPVTDDDIRTQVDDILCGMALSTEKQTNIQRTPETRERPQKAPRRDKKCKKSLAKSLALTAIREDVSAKASSVEQVKACTTEGAHVKIPKKLRKRRRDEECSSPSQDIARATKRSCTDDDYTQEDTLVAAKTSASKTDGGNDVEMTNSVKDSLHDKLPDQELSFLLADGVETFLGGDFKNGITMYERLKTRKRMASSKAEESIALTASPKHKKTQQAPAEEETGTPKQDSFAGKRNATPGRDSVPGKRNGTPKRDTVDGKRNTTPKQDSVAGTRTTPPKHDSIAGTSNTTPKRDSVPGKRNTTPKRDSVAGTRSITPKQDSVPGKRNTAPKRDLFPGKRNTTPKRDSVAGKKSNTSPKTPTSKRCLKKVEAKNIALVTIFDYPLSSTPTRRTRSSSTPSDHIDILLIDDQRKSFANCIHSVATCHTKLVLDVPSHHKVAPENMESRDTSLSCSTELTSTPANYQSSSRNVKSNEQDTSSQKLSDASFSLRMTNTSGLESSRLSTSTPVALSVSNALHSGRKAKPRASKSKETLKEKVRKNKKRVLCGKDVSFKKQGSHDVFEYMDDFMYL